MSTTVPTTNPEPHATSGADYKIKARFQLLSDLHLELPPKPADHGKPIIFTRPQPPPTPSPLHRLSRFLPDSWKESLTSSKNTKPNSSTTPVPPTPPTQGTSYTIFNIPPTAPYLLLAGDIGNLSHYDQYLEFLQIQAKQFKHIYLILGNHEFYHLPGGHAEGLEIGRKLEEELAGKLTVLSRKRVDLPDEGVTILGCTFWSRISDEQRERISGAVSDFRGRIKGEWGVDQHNKEWEGDVSWLQSALEEIDAEDREGRGIMGERWGIGSSASFQQDQPPTRRWRVLVATHHSPTFWKSSKPQHEGRGFGSAFCTELLFPGGLQSGDKENPTWEGSGSNGGNSTTITENPIQSLASWKGSERIAAWAFGHTHFCTDYTWSGEDVPDKTSSESPTTQPTEPITAVPRKVRIVANQRGYWISSEDNKFNPAFVLEV